VGRLCGTGEEGSERLIDKKGKERQMASEENSGSAPANGVMADGGKVDAAQGQSQQPGQEQAGMDPQQQAQMAQQQMQQQAQQGQFQSVSLYVGDLHPEVTEGLLFDMFSAVGPVASIRVCRDAVTRRSLGYAYVNFHNAADADRALKTMNYTSIKGRPCRIMWSQRDPSLRKTGHGNVYVKNIDPSIDHKALSDTFSLFGKILSSKVVTDREGNSKGYGFVHFETPEAAQEAIEQINGMEIAGKQVYVGPFVKRSERGSSEWTNLFIKNVPKHWDDKRFEEFFAEAGPVQSAVIMKDGDGKSKGFGFVDFSEHESAVKAIEMFDAKELAADEDSEKLPEDTPSEDTTGEDDVKEDAKDEKDGDGDEEKDKDETEGEASEDSKKEEDGAEKKPVRRTVRLFVAKAQKKAQRERELSEKFEQLKMDRQNKYQGVNIYVKNLDESVTDEDLHDNFSKFGSVTSVRVMREPDSEVTLPNGEKQKKPGISKGFGFVCFTDPESSLKAISEMQGVVIKGKPIYVALAQRKETRRAQLEAQHRRLPRGVVPGMQPGIFPNPMMQFGGGVGMQGVGGGMPGAMPGVMPAQPRGYGYMPMMMPRGMPARGVAGGYGAMPGQGMPPGVPGGYPGGPGMPGGMQGGNMMGAGGRGGGRGSRGGRGGRGGKSGPGGQQDGQAFKYNPNVRNQPGGMHPQNMMQQPPQQMMQGSVPPMSQQQLEPLTAAALASATEQDQKNMIGERLYPLIAESPLVAQNNDSSVNIPGKITGMLLEMDNPELLNLLESPDALQEKIDEAIEVLRNASQG